MFVNNSRRGYLGGDQYASGDFLIAFTNETAPKINGKPAIRCIVRKVALRQCGNFMMGRTTLLGHRFSLSGAYGADGLTVDTITHRRPVPEPVKPSSFDTDEGPTPEERDAYYAALDAWLAIRSEPVEIAPGLWDRLHALPDDLVAAFWSGGGHNSAGSEGPDLHAWAVANLATLRHLKPASKAHARP